MLRHEPIIAGLGMFLALTLIWGFLGGLAYLITMNGLTLMAFWHDKQQAKRGCWRIPEATLLILALLGGALGAMLGVFIFRHKVRKYGFVILLVLVILLHGWLLMW